MFVTAWVGILDLDNGNLTYASAGHNPPIVVDSNDGKAHQLETKVSLVLGGLPDVKYKNNKGTFNPGQILVLYTDGVSEANDPKGHLYGEPKLLMLLEKLSQNNCKEICEKTIEDVDKFAKGAEQFDDITILALKYLPN